jgi:ABC-2 type transport system permease protein
MAVHDRGYKRYAGELTPAWSRFLILPRYAYKEVFRSKFFLVVYILAFIMPLVGTVMIYVSHNTRLLELFQIPAEFDGDIAPLGAAAALTFLSVQSWWAFALMIIVGPSLVSRDMMNNALPLYLGRPFSRTEYVLGKFSVLAILLSSITWVPGLFLFALHSYLHPGWMASHLNLAAALFVGPWILILILSLLVLAVSAHVRRALLARGLIVILFTVFGFFGQTINFALGTNLGSYLNMTELIGSTLIGLCGLDVPLPVGPLSAGVALLVIAGLCLWTLSRKVQAYEIVT